MTTNLCLSGNEKIDPRVKRTHRLILTAFRDLMEEKDFNKVTVQDITARAEINRATFYAHFPDKYALLEASIHEIFFEELDKRTLNACRFSVDNLKALMVTVCGFVSSSHRHCREGDSQFESLVERQVRGQIEIVMRRWIEQVGSEIDSETAVTIASWTIYGLVSQWNQQKEKNRKPAEQFADEVLPILVENLRLKQRGPGKEGISTLTVDLVPASTGA